MEESDNKVDRSAKIFAASYSPQEIVQRFEEVFASLNLKKEIAYLGNRLNSFFKRRRSMREFTVLAVVLWKLALESSFPTQKEEVFRLFISNSPILDKGSKRKLLLERIKFYDGLVAEKKHTDFTPAAVYMASYFSNDLSNRKTLQLKLSLAIRRLYQVIFDHLILTGT
jgi:hypothetical protein